jgi:Protein of unknown function (DUF3592)
MTVSTRAEHVFFLLLGVVAIAVGMSFIIRDRHLLQTGVRTTGVVVANDIADGGRSGPTYYPQVRFVGPGNHTYVVQGPRRAKTPEFPVGEVVTVYYDPQQPQTALVASARMGADASIIIVAGWVAVLIGACPLVWRLLLRRVRRAHAHEDE